MSADMSAVLAFTAVVRHGSFTAAAKELRVPKTTLSRWICDLEVSLGTRLLNRTTRRLSLTETGTVYYRYCRNIADTLAEAEAAVGQLQQAPRGWLRVTASFSVAVNLLGPLIGAFSLRYPDVHIDLSLTHARQDIVGEGIDVALRLGPLADSGLIGRYLGRFTNRLYAAPSYVAACGSPTHPRDIARHRALATRVAMRDGGYVWPMQDCAQTEPLQDYAITPVLLADDPEVLKGALVAGLGLTMATDLVMRPLLAAQTVVPLLPGWVGRCPELHAVFPQGGIQAPKLRAFVDFLAENLMKP